MVTPAEIPPDPPLLKGGGPPGRDATKYLANFCDTTLAPSCEPLGRADHGAQDPHMTPESPPHLIMLFHQPCEEVAPRFYDTVTDAFHQARLSLSAAQETSYRRQSKKSFLPNRTGLSRRR